MWGLSLVFPLHGRAPVPCSSDPHCPSCKERWLACGPLSWSLEAPAASVPPRLPPPGPVNLPRSVHRIGAGLH